MRKILLICLLLPSIFIFGENLMEKVALNAQLYETVNFSQLKLTILDAINLTNEKDVIAAYLTQVDKKIVWVVCTFNHEYRISAEEAKILWKKPLETRFFTYEVGLREAISLAVMSIGRNVLFGVYQTDSWMVGNNRNLATVSMKTPAILKIELTQEVFKKVQQEMLKRQQ